MDQALVGIVVFISRLEIERVNFLGTANISKKKKASLSDGIEPATLPISVE